MSEEWRSWPRRQRIVQQIDEYLRQSPEVGVKSAQEFENSLFQKATKEEDYLQYVSKIIKYLKEKVQNNNQSSNLAAMLGGSQQNNSPRLQMGQPGPNTVIGTTAMTPNSQSQMIHTSLNSQMVQGISNQAANQQMINSQASNSQMVNNQGPNSQNMALNNQGSNAQIMGNQGPTSQIGNNNQGLGPQMINQGSASQISNNQGSSQQMLNSNQGSSALIMNNQNSSVQMINNQGTGIQINQGPGSQMLSNQGPGPQMINNQGPTMQLINNQGSSSQMQSINPNMMQNQMIGGMRMQQQQLVQSMPSQGLHEMGNWQNQGRPRRPNDVVLLNPRHAPGMATVNQMGQIRMGQMIPEMSIGGTMVRTGMMQRVQSPSFQIGGPGPHLRPGPPNSAASPVMQQHMPHNSPFISPSPNAASPGLANTPGRPMNQFSAPSPGGMVNTPGQPTSNMSSEDRAYLEKVKQLQSKYLDTLREVAQRFENNDSENARKVRNLLEVIENPQRRATKGMETLKACELVLERLGFQQQPSANKPQTKDNPVVVLFDAINMALKSPSGYHTIHRTLAPALRTLMGPDIDQHVPKKMKVSSTKASEISLISNVVQGEVARLPARFKLNLENQNTDDLNLICHLDDPNLPCVPPLTILVPPTYPDSPPQCIVPVLTYETTDFLKKVRLIMKNKLYHLPEVCSLTMLLDAWEMSVRRACSNAPYESNSISPLNDLHFFN